MACSSPSGNAKHLLGVHAHLILKKYLVIFIPIHQSKNHSFKFPLRDMILPLDLVVYYQMSAIDQHMKG